MSKSKVTITLNKTIDLEILIDGSSMLFEDVWLTTVQPGAQERYGHLGGYTISQGPLELSFRVPERIVQTPISDLVPDEEPFTLPS